MEKIKRIDRSLVYKGAWISMYTDSMAFANGNRANWDFIHHNGAAAMVAEDADGKIIMIRQWRPGAENEILELPAGGINQSEDPINAAIRELREETGAVCAEAKPLLMIQPSPAYNDEKVHMFYCKVTDYVTTELDENEYVTVERYTLDELIAMIMQGTISDSKTVAGLFAYKEMQKRRDDMEAYIQEFCNYRIEKKKISENTVLAYRSDLQRLISFLKENGVESPEQVTETQLNSFVLASERAGLKASSVVRLVSSIRNFFDYLTKKGIIKEDPAERIKAPKAETVAPNVISVNDLEALLVMPDLTTPKGLRDRAMLEMLYATGLHLNTLLTLKLSQVQVKFRALLVEEGEENRVLPLGKPACEAIAIYLEQGRELLKKEDSDPELLFYNKSGQEMTRQGFFKRITEYAKKAGLPNITPRILRNSMITHLMNNGASYAGVHQLLGTKRLSAAMNYQRQTQSIPELYKNAHPRA